MPAAGHRYRHSRLVVELRRDHIDAFRQIFRAPGAHRRRRAKQVHHHVDVVDQQVKYPAARLPPYWPAIPSSPVPRSVAEQCVPTSPKLPDLTALISGI